MDFEVERCTRHCAITDRQFAEGEEFYSALVTQGAEVQRLDYAVAAWQGPPEGALGWWKSRMPRDAKKTKLAPSEVLLQLFNELASTLGSAEGQENEDNPPVEPGAERSVAYRRAMRYVLALLMIRRRILRLEDTTEDDQGHETLVLYCGRDEATHHVPVEMPDEAGVLQIQEELARLLFADAEGNADSGMRNATAEDTNPQSAIRNPQQGS